MLSLLMKTFEQIKENGEQNQNVYNIFKVWRTNSKWGEQIQNVEKIFKMWRAFSKYQRNYLNVFTLMTVNMLEKVLISCDINSYMFKSSISILLFLNNSKYFCIFEKNSP